MKKLLLALVAIFAMGNVIAGGCCPKKRSCKPKCEKPVVNCAPKPKCVKRCVVEKCVEPRKICETNCYYECPTDCEVQSGDYVARSEDITNGRSMKRQRTY